MGLMARTVEEAVAAVKVETREELDEETLDVEEVDDAREVELDEARVLLRVVPVELDLTLLVELERVLDVDALVLEDDARVLELERAVVLDVNLVLVLDLEEED